MFRFVAYRRVSTEKQGRSGLGLEAEEAAVQGFMAAQGREAKLLATYTEVESGKRDDRPELAKALEHVRLTGATLIIAKLDRLSRDAHFLLGLQKADVDFIACDMPRADRFTVGIMAMLAQKERELISERTKAALAAAKARGRKLGNPNGAAHLRAYGNEKAIEAVQSDAQERAERLRRVIVDLRSSGVTSANALAKALNERHVATARGGAWTARSVLNVLERLGAV
jgi:DNA invertase Pin-like site-specific DNA recombinase